MMMTCGHVITKESLQKLCKSNGCVFVFPVSGLLDSWCFQTCQMPILPRRVDADERSARCFLVCKNIRRLYYYCLHHFCISILSKYYRTCIITEGVVRLGIIKRSRTSVTFQVLGRSNEPGYHSVTRTPSRTLIDSPSSSESLPHPDSCSLLWCFRQWRVC